MDNDLLIIGAGLAGLGLAASYWLWPERHRHRLSQAVRRVSQPPTIIAATGSGQAAALITVLWQMSLIALVATLVTALLVPGPGDWQAVSIGSVLLAAMLGLAVVARRGRADVATRLLPLVLFIIFSVALAVIGVSGPLASTYLIVVTCAALLAGARAAGLYAVASVLALFIISAVRPVVVPAPEVAAPPPDLALWLGYVSVFAVVGQLLRLTAERLRASVNRANDLLAEQAAQAQQLDLALATERKQARQMEVLADIAHRLTGFDGAEALLSELLEHVHLSFGCLRLALYLVEDDRLVLRASRGPAAPDDSGLAWAAHVERTGATCVVDDSGAVRAGAGPAGRVAVPLRLAKTVVGVLAAEHSPPAMFDVLEVRNLESLADLIVTGLNTSRLFARLRANAERTEALRRLGAAVNASLDPDRVLQTICLETCRAFQADEVEVWLMDSGAGRLRLAAASGHYAPAVVVEPATGPSAAARALRGGRTLVLPAPPGQRALAADAALRSLLAAPLSKDHQRLGALVIAEARRHQPFTNEDAAAAELLGAQVAAAILNARLYAEHRHRAEQLRLLNEITRASLEIAGFDDLLRTLAERIGELINADGCYITVWDEARQAAHIAAASRALAGRVLGPPESLPPAEQDLTEAVLKAGSPVTVVEAATSPHCGPERAARLRVHSLLGVPLIAGEQRLGAAILTFQQRRDFEPEAVAYAEQAGRQIALALARARALEAERRRNVELETLRQASLHVTSSLQLQPVLTAILEQALKFVAGDDAHIFLYDGERLAFGAALWAGGVRQEPYAKIRPGGLTYTVARSGERVVVPDAKAHPLFAGWTWGGAIIGLPLRIGAQVRGVMNVAFDQPHVFDEHELLLLELLADQAAIALENARLYQAQQRQAEEQSLLWQASRDFGAGLAQDQVLTAVARHMTAALHSAGCAISLWQRAANRLVTLLDYSWPDPTGSQANSQSLSLADRPLTLRVLQTGEPAIADANDPAVDPAVRERLRHSTNTGLMLLPLRSGEAVFGLVEVYRTEAMPPFSPADLRLAQSLTAQAAVALDNARLHSALQAKVNELDALLTANDALLSTLELETLLNNILTAALRAVPAADKGWIALADATARQLRVRAVQGYADPRAGAMSYDWNEGYSGRVAHQVRPQLIADTRATPGAWYDGGIPEIRDTRSAVMAPLAPKGSAGPALGVISLDSTRLAAFGEADVRILEAFAAAAAVAIDNAQLHAEVQRLAVTDSLTGLANPRAFELALSTEVYRAERYGHALSLIIMDIDSFKEYNDTYGHPAGNERLKAIAAILRAAVRDPDLPVRYGGEEFALLLPHTAKPGALVLAERLRAAAAAAAPEPASPGVACSGYTISLGVASLPLDARSALGLLLAADNAELAAKRAGKNRVCAAPPVNAPGPPGA